MSERTFRWQERELVVNARRSDGQLISQRPRAEELRCWLRRVGTAEFLLRDPQDPTAFHTVFAIHDGEIWWIHFDGRTWPLQRVRRRGTTGLAASGTLASPIPATVTEVAVATGDRVQAGDLLLVVSAMKMQLEIKAPHAGIVQDLKAKPGDQVEGGVALLRIEVAPTS